ncbi:carbon-nitrogen hydrolase family protein [Arsenicibacter rosenii]|uniref:CN hydrolase domain-containing protein n=1 Tax=Arsenicibacter rosenii TaxID=1750698 RepID=A0A1S2VLG5_9BACT|nr:carbon-nitrogen hydrolase family protein [Arsenicibacter rosenii]OIN59601.1 hypothetical protein BLX24_06920 [Arsenicibacter rosenii]
MRICLAQLQSANGDLAANLDRHCRAIRTAADYQTNLIIFPELSLTGYEPTLAASLATTPDDPVLAPLQSLSDRYRMVIAAGLPIRTPEGLCIGLVICQPNQPQQLYTKHFLHADEVPFFTAGRHVPMLDFPFDRVALAICYELSVDEHTRQVIQPETTVYLASVAKTAIGMQQATLRMADIARTYQVPALLVNAIGPADTFVNAGQSAAWTAKGTLMGQLPADEEGLLIVDTRTETALSIPLILKTA